MCKCWQKGFGRDGKMSFYRVFKLEGSGIKGDVVLVKEKDMKRFDWLIGLVEEVILSEDVKVWKIRVKVI